MSLPVSLPTPASAAPGSVVLPPHGRPGSPGTRTPIRTSKAPGSMPRPSSRPLSCLAVSGVPQSTELANSSGGSVFPSSGDDFPAFRTPCSATWCGLPQPSPGSRILRPQLRILCSKDAADRAGTAALHGLSPISLSVSYPGRSGSRLGHVPSYSRTPGTAAASPMVVLNRHPRRVFCR